MKLKKKYQEQIKDIFLNLNADFNDDKIAEMIHKSIGVNQKLIASLIRSNKKDWQEEARRKKEIEDNDRLYNNITRTTYSGNVVMRISGF